MFLSTTRRTHNSKKQGRNKDMILNDSCCLNGQIDCRWWCLGADDACYKVTTKWTKKQWFVQPQWRLDCRWTLRWTHPQSPPSKKCTIITTKNEWFLQLQWRQLDCRWWRLRADHWCGWRIAGPWQDLFQECAEAVCRPPAKHSQKSMP